MGYDSLIDHTMNIVWTAHFFKGGGFYLPQSEGRNPINYKKGTEVWYKDRSLYKKWVKLFRSKFFKVIIFKLTVEINLPSIMCYMFEEKSIFSSSTIL